RAFAESAIGKNQQAALAELGHFARTHPRDAVGHYELGTAESTAKPAAALAELNRALALQPQMAPAHFARGLLYYRKDDLKAAVADFSVAVKQQPDNAAALDRLAEMYLALNRTGDALPLLRKAAALAPGDSRVQLHLGQALVKAGKQTEARQAFERYRDLKNGAESVPHAAGLLAFLGLSRARQYAQYRAGVERAVKKDPRNAEAQVRYLGILLNDGDVQSARKVCGRLAGLHPAPAQLRQAAHELLAAGQYALAQPLLEKAGAPQPEKQNPER
ncbi:MAG: tetratricopeptide repeat protein, partial [Candidatus Acidiferrales bacterium]